MPQYSKTTWVDGTAPAISAANLNKLEQGVFDSLRQDGSTTMSAQLVTIAGSAATPAIAPTGDSNTGIFFPAADTIAFGEGGAEAMRITSAGNVGIGTISPSSRLEVSGAITRTVTVDGSNASPANETGLIYRHPVTASNRAGINFLNTYTNNGAAWMSFYTTDTSNNYAERMRIDATGNVGIGTQSPSTKLDISNSIGSFSDNVRIINTGTSFGQRPQIGLYSNNQTTTGLTLGKNNSGDGGDAFLINGANSAIIFGTNATEKMRLTAAGYLLIGYTTSNGAYPLQVNGQIFATSSTIATSDGRYKKDIVSLDGALDIVAALNPVQFNWKEHPVHKFNTDVPTIGFIAQEVAEVLKDKAYLTSVIKKSECTWETETGEIIEREVTRDVEKQVEREVIEEVDGEEIARTITETIIEQVTEIVNEPVKETHIEEFYGIAESNMIAILTKAIQELKAEVDALKAQIAK